MVNDANMLSMNSSELNSKVKNVGFSLLDPIFKQYGWHIIKNEMNYIGYTKIGNETDLFEIKIGPKSIQVGIPIRNSPFQYNTSFNNYYQASEYIESRFLDFINEKKIEMDINN
jgi:hypothetical protein